MGRRNRFVMLSQQPADFCSDLLHAGSFPREQDAILTHALVLKKGSERWTVQKGTPELMRSFRANDLEPRSDLD
jgi:hypothetical protein